MGKLKNFLPLSRGFFDHELWKENREFSKAEAWIWMLTQARYSDREGKRWVNGRLVTWGKGQFLGSVRFLKDSWNWKSTGKVDRFLQYLKDENMIEVSTEQGVNIVTLCNHPTYNEHLYGNGTQIGTPNGTGHPSQNGASETSDGPESQPEVQAPSQAEEPEEKPDPKESSGPDYRAITEELVDYWNELNDTRLRVAKSRRKVTQLRQRMKTFDLDEIKKAIYNRSANEWIQENNQQANWDACLRNDAAIEEWLHREPKKNTKNVHPTKKGFVTKQQAVAHAEEHRRPFKESIYQSIEYKGDTYYRLPKN